MALNVNHVIFCVMFVLLTLAYYDNSRSFIMCESAI